MKWQPRVFRKKGTVDNAAAGGPVKPIEFVIQEQTKAEKPRNRPKSKRSLPFFPLPTLGTSSVSASSRDCSEEKTHVVVPRIGIHLSTAELREEAKARGIDSCYLPNDKVDLLEFLVDGSIHLRETEAWKDVENLRNKMEEDCRRIESEKEALIANETEELIRRCESQHPAGEQSVDWARENSLLDETMHLTLPTRYYGNQASHLTDDTSTCIGTEVAENMVERTVLNLLQGKYDLANLTCGGGGSTATTPCTAAVPPHALVSNTLWGDEHSHFNSECGSGSDSHSDSDSDSDSEIGSDIGSDNDPEDDNIFVSKDIASPIKSSTDLNMQPGVKWQAALQFEQWIIDPPIKNKNPQGNLLKGFTVWCSLMSFTETSCHTPKPSTKYFDSSYKTLEDANDRARFLFYWQNPWAHPEDMEDIVNIKSDAETHKDSASSFHCVHPHGEEWRVSVVPDAVFMYLDHATQQRHNFDNKGDF